MPSDIHRVWVLTPSLLTVQMKVELKLMPGLLACSVVLIYDQDHELWKLSWMFTLNYSLLSTAITGPSLTAYSNTGDQMSLTSL